MDIGSRLRELRKGLGVSGNALARMAGVAQSTISEIESNRTVPSINVLNKLCRAMGITLGDFFAPESTHQSSLPPEFRRLLMLAQQLELHQLEMICLVIEAMLEQKKAGAQSMAAESTSLYPDIKEELKKKNK